MSVLAGWRRPFNNDITIKRARKAELEVAIEDLKLRGYELIRTGEENREVKRFDYRDNSLGHLGKHKYTQHDTIQKFYAVMRKRKVETV